MKVLNLYAGIGGNRKLWADCKVTAVEIREDIAAVYRDYFPQDEIVISDAHEYLLNHYSEFDFIWSSPPCQTHSRARYWGSKGGTTSIKYPDMKLYQEILFLQHYFFGKWIVENVNPFYEPMIKPTREIGRHLFWSNFTISNMEEIKKTYVYRGTRNEWSALHGFDLSKYKLDSRKDQIYRNCVHPETGLHIFNCAKGIYQSENVKQISIFNETL